MMKFIWKRIGKQGWSSTMAQKAFLLCSVLVFCVLGAFTWLMVGI